MTRRLTSLLSEAPLKVLRSGALCRDLLSLTSLLSEAPLKAILCAFGLLGRCGRSHLAFERGPVEGTLVLLVGCRAPAVSPRF